MEETSVWRLLFETLELIGKIVCLIVAAYLFFKYGHEYYLTNKDIDVYIALLILLLFIWGSHK